MAINFGAALGAAAKSGMDTYMSMEENARRKKELEFREAEANWQEEQRQQERKLNEITSQTLGMGDTRVTGQDYTGVTGGIDTAEPALRTEAYTPQQKMADFKQRALGAGIPIQKVTAISRAHRAEKYDEKEEMALEFNNQVMSDIKANPNDLGAVFKKHFEPLYNEGKLPGLNDGSKVELIPDGKGGQSMLFKDSKGKPTQPPVPLDIHAMESITQKWGDLMMKSSSPANYWKSRETDLKAREVKVKEDLVPSEIRKNNALAGQASAHAGVYNNLLETAKNNKAAGEAMQPFLDKLAGLKDPTGTDKAEADRLMVQAATAGAQKSKDVAGLLSTLRKPDRAAVSAEQEKAAYAAWNEANTPEQQRAVRAKYPNVQLGGPSALDKAIAAREQQSGGNPAAPEVPGRPLYNKDMSELQRMARRPIGVSTAEANEAQAELEARKGESRMSAIPR